MTPHDDLGPYFTELRNEAVKLADYAEQAAQHYADGDVQAACDVVSVLHYNLSHVGDARNGLLHDLAEIGIEPGK